MDKGGSNDDSIIDLIVGFVKDFFKGVSIGEGIGLGINKIRSSYNGWRIIKYNDKNKNNIKIK